MSFKHTFTDNMYDLAGQGIPLIVPINQNQVAKAIQLDSKLSKTLYESLGEDVSKLKTAVRAQVSRGIANGSTWNEIAKTLAERNMKNTPFGTAINNSIRIARTEGHRVQNAAKMDSMSEAKKKGADVVKQWDSTLDGRTRDTHRKLDGQIRELDEPFEVAGMKADAPGYFGNPAEDCNCRCAVLQRAKWALDESELETLKERASFHGLLVDDPKEYGHAKEMDFSTFKHKYLNSSSEDAKIENNKKVREWYINNVSKIHNGINGNISEERKAKIAFNRRNDIRNEARNRMLDRSKKQELEREHPNMTFEELVDSKMKRKNLTREESIADIYNTATKTNANVNKELGIE